MFEARTFVNHSVRSLSDLCFFGPNEVAVRPGDVEQDEVDSPLLLSRGVGLFHSVHVSLYDLWRGSMRYAGKSSCLGKVGMKQ